MNDDRMTQDLRAVMESLKTDIRDAEAVLKKAFDEYEKYENGKAATLMGQGLKIREAENKAYQKGYKEGVEYGRECREAEEDEAAEKASAAAAGSSAATAAGRKNLVEIGDLEAGQTVKFADIEWTILDPDYENVGTVLVLSKDVLFEKAFDENNCNNWERSALRAYLNGEWLEEIREKMDGDPLKSFYRDLTSDDGLDDYGFCYDTASIVSCDEYRRYRHYIKNKSDWWWTLTPYSTPYSGYSFNARYVRTDGTLYNRNACNGHSGVSPAFCVSSDFVVEVVE